MEVLQILGLTLLSYLLGSMPSAIWVGKAFYGVDVRNFGSGNAGATNTFRVLGKKAGSFVMFLDIMKGFTAASLVWLLSFTEPGTIRFVNLQLLFGMSAVIGHIFPVYVGFRGGKGIATLLGMIISIHYLSAVACIVLFLLILFATRYVSLGSILAAIAFPLLTVFIFGQHEPLFIAFGVAAAVLVLLTHQKNIKRLVEGTENKAKIFRKHRRQDL